MLSQAVTLVQDVQLVCFTVLFAFFAFQHWDDTARRWLWYSFLANTAGAILDFTAPHLRWWLGVGVDSQMIPLSYVMTSVAIVAFLGRFRIASWIAWGMFLVCLPPVFWWSVQRHDVPLWTLQDFSIAAQCVLSGALLLARNSRETRLARHLLAWFLLAFAAIEFTRVGVTVFTGINVDIFSPRLSSFCMVAYVVNTSVLPLGFIWMMNSRLEADLRRQALLDPLTQVLNRRGLSLELDREVARSRRSGEPVTIALADLDHFKVWNDTFGHGSGDAVLSGVAALLRSKLRRTDVIARFGGEEFVLVLPATGVQEARSMLERLCAAIAELSIDDGFVVGSGAAGKSARRITASFGAAVDSGAFIDQEMLLHQADLALYRAKRDGRNCVRFFEPADTPAPAAYKSAAPLQHLEHEVI